MARFSQEVKSSKINWRTLVETFDRGRRNYQPVVYHFARHVTKREPRVPGIYRTS